VPRIASELEFEIDSETADAIRAAPERARQAAPERRREELMRIFELDRAGAAVRLLDDLRLLDVLLPELAACRGVGQPPAYHVHDVFDHLLAALDAMDVLCATSRPRSDQAWMWEVLWETFAWDAARLRTYVDERKGLLKLSALLHDIAKPQTRTVDPDGRIRFLGHADAGEKVAAPMLRRLRFS
jgi:tRNA nucleotidyltransferase/poly(A) polymerase